MRVVLVAMSLGISFATGYTMTACVKYLLPRWPKGVRAHSSGLSSCIVLFQYELRTKIIDHPFERDNCTSGIVLAMICPLLSAASLEVSSLSGSQATL